MQTQTAIFGGGCFWCTEAVFKMLKGVSAVEPGYGSTTLTTSAKAPTYEEVSSGHTGFVEVIKLEYDPALIKYNDLLTVFFGSHDPTTVNQQGADIGTQYRSVIFSTSDEQKHEAEQFIADLNALSTLGKPIVTDVEPLGEYHTAEEYHKDYYARNKNASYCQLVINPKLEKVQMQFADLLK